MARVQSAQDPNALRGEALDDAMWSWQETAEGSEASAILSRLGFWVNWQAQALLAAFGIWWGGNASFCLLDGRGIGSGKHEKDRESNWEEEGCRGAKRT